MRLNSVRRVCMFLAGVCFTPLILNAQAVPAVYPARTTLDLNLNTAIDSSTAFTGSPVEAKMLKAALGLPAGTTLVGIVEIARPADAITKSRAEIRVGFNEVRLPSGERHRVTAPLKDLGLSRVGSAQAELAELDRSGLISRGIFRLGGIATVKSDKKSLRIKPGRLKAALTDSFSPDAFMRYRVEGVELRPAAGALLDKIEAASGQPLHIEKQSTGLEGVISRGIVSDDGTPTLVLGPDADITETLIVHELFHIDQRLRQFSNGIDLRILGPVSSDFESQLGPMLGAYLLDPIAHAIFFPQMVEMGLDPYEQEAVSIRRVVAAGGFPFEVSEALAYRTEAMSLWYMTAALGAGDPAVVSENDRLFEKEGFSESIQRGRGTVNIFKSRNPQTPEQAAETVVASLNCLLGSLGTFSFDGWSTREKGKRSERAAIVTFRSSAEAAPQCN